jgi:hypothetical protein
VILVMVLPGFSNLSILVPLFSDVIMVEFGDWAVDSHLGENTFRCLDWVISGNPQCQGGDFGVLGKLSSRKICLIFFFFLQC